MHIYFVRALALFYTMSVGKLLKCVTWSSPSHFKTPIYLKMCPNAFYVVFIKDC